MEKLLMLWQATGLYHISPGQVLMILVCLLLIYLAIRKGFEPLLLIPIGFGGVLANLPVAGMAEAGGLLALIYDVGIPTSVFPLLLSPSLAEQMALHPFSWHPSWRPICWGRLRWQPIPIWHWCP